MFLRVCYAVRGFLFRYTCPLRTSGWWNDKAQSFWTPQGGIQASNDRFQCWLTDDWPLLITQSAELGFPSARLRRFSLKYITSWEARARTQLSSLSIGAVFNDEVNFLGRGAFRADCIVIVFTLLPIPVIVGCRKITAHHAFLCLILIVIWHLLYTYVVRFINESFQALSRLASGRCTSSYFYYPIICGLFCLTSNQSLCGVGLAVKRWPYDI